MTAATTTPDEEIQGTDDHNIDQVEAGAEDGDMSSSDEPAVGGQIESSGDGMFSDKQNDDDDVTVIVLDQNPEEMNSRQFPIAWNEQAGPQVEERRRTILLRELQRVQRTSFLHFLILCLIPTVLLFIVIATVVNEDEDCSSDATFCEKEERNFINAFTTRCVCEAIAVPRPY